MKRKQFFITQRLPQIAFLLTGLTTILGVARGAERVLDTKMHHLRNGEREWSEFPEQPDAGKLELRFEGTKNEAAFSVSVRQQDVKQNWTVALNGKMLGKLTIDENDMILHFAVPPGTLSDGENVFRVEQPGSNKPVPDDIRVGEIRLYDRPVQDVLNECRISVKVVDGDKPLPARITVLTTNGALQSVGASSNDFMAVRPGVIYTASGQAEFGLPAGKYSIYAGRGFEYSLARKDVSVGEGTASERTLPITLHIRREVPVEGYAVCDTHVHTLTHSGHGDATVHERMITLAAEGIELPIATDHNVQIDHDTFARQVFVRQYFTPVVGNEVTTTVGHFNVFPIPKEAKPPDHKLNEWGKILTKSSDCPATRPSS